MKTSVNLITTTVVLAAFVGLFFGTTSVAIPSASATPAESPLQTLTHVTIQNTTTSVQDPLPGHQGHQAAIILPPRDDGKLWVGIVTWTASKPVELVVLHGYTNVTTDSAHGVPLIAKPPTGALAITLIGPNQFMPSSNPVPSGTAPFVGSAVAFHTLSGAKFTVTYSLDATANTPTKTIAKVLS
ncbi:MAG: hypothetical protein WAM14_07570 [Candidatus Nitrosopolaris sp.]